MTGVGTSQGVVSTSANWIRVSPLTFDGSQAFTVGIDARWVDPNASNVGTITFTMGDVRGSIPVKAGFGPTLTVGFILSPQSVRVGEGDEFALEPHGSQSADAVRPRGPHGGLGPGSRRFAGRSGVGGR